MLRRPSLPVLAACAGQTIWGFSYLFIRVALRYAQPDVMLAMRFVLAFLLINIPLLTGRQKISLKGKPLKPLVLFAITEPLYFLAESYAVLYTNSTYTGVMLAVSPIGSIALAALLLREFPSKRQLLFCLLPITGVILITLSGSSLGIVTPKGAFFWRPPVWYRRPCGRSTAYPPSPTPPLNARISLCSPSPPSFSSSLWSGSVTSPRPLRNPCPTRFSCWPSSF